jgi:cyclophilin family peptidyl-prolyl cis-trans isomerase
MPHLLHLAIVITTVFALCVAPSAAQTKDGKQDKPPARKQDIASKLKDDAVTAKDPVIVALDKFSKGKVSSKRQDWRQSLPEPPVQKFAGGREYRWHLLTNHGEMVVRLRPDVAPMHVTSTIYLARTGFYDGLVFHRAIAGFMAQGGCPLGNGTGNAGYKMDTVASAQATHDKAGILSAANEGTPKTESSQFFLTYAPAPHLDGKHTVYGEVIAGRDVLKVFEARSGDNENDKPKEKLALERAWITVVVTEDPPKGEKTDKAGK